MGGEGNIDCGQVCGGEKEPQIERDTDMWGEMESKIGLEMDESPKKGCLRITSHFFPPIRLNLKQKR